jgi:hypothetical protein
MAHAAAPALNTHDTVAPIDDAKFNAVGDSPLQTPVDILLPNLDIEVGLFLREEEGIHAAVKVRILW